MSPKEKQQMCLEYLREHPGIKEKDALKALNIGRSTFYKIKNLL
jgi:ACT domain-containing protein